MKPKTAWGEGTSATRSGSVGGMARPGVGSRSGPLPRGGSAGGPDSPVDYSKTLSGPAYREKGFNASTSVSARVIPEYDASRDRNCPYTQTNKFKSHLQSVERAAALEKKRQVDEQRRADARERGALLVAGGVAANAPGRSVSPIDTAAHSKGRRAGPKTGAVPR